jgi:SAM-dependent methyltransferase
LDRGDPEWSCLGCGARFRILRGIADLRTTDDLFLANRDDWEFALRLDQAYDRVDFRELLELYFDLSPEIPLELRRRQIGHILTAPGRARMWQEALGGARRTSLLDLGCGTGSFLSAAAERYQAAYGIDIAMRWLLVARKRLDEEGLGHVRLVCGCAERLPFDDHTFDAIVGGDVIEHVGDQAMTLAEAHRVLREGGRLFLASPNRYSLAPEPHVQVWGVGYLPRSWMPAYVRWASGVDFRAIRTLGIGEWTQLLAQSPFGAGQIVAPGLPGDDFASFGPVKRCVGRVYNAIVATRPGHAAARRVGPLFHVVCRRDHGEAVHAPSPPTRRRSTPTAAQS